MTTVRTTGPGSSDSVRVARRARRADTRDARRSDDQQLRVAEGRSRSGLLRQSGVGFVFCGLVIVGILFGVAVVGTNLVGQQAHIDRTNARIAEAEARAEVLRVQLAELRSPQYVTTRAATVLGMIPAPTPVYLQPRPTDDARAAEVPVTTPPTTARPAPSTTTPPTTARAGTTTTVRR